MSDDNSITFTAPELERVEDVSTVEPEVAPAPAPAPRAGKRPSVDKYKPFSW